MNKQEALATIKDYINKACVFNCTGDLWWHEPGEIAVQFYTPEDLQKHLSSSYGDDMMFTLECIDENYEWKNEDLLPIAAIGSGVALDPEEEKQFIKHGIDPFLHDAFGYMFFELSTGKVITTHSDGWSLDNKPYTIAGLIKEMGIRLK